MKKNIGIITVLLAVVLAVAGMYVVARQQGAQEPEVRTPAADRPNRQWSNWPTKYQQGEQLPIPQEYYQEDGTVKPGYEGSVWLLEYFGNPVREDKWEEYVAYMTPGWEMSKAKTEADYYEERAKKAASGEWDPYAGMDYKEYQEVSLLKNWAPRAWAVRVGLIPVDSPRVTLEQIREIVSGADAMRKIREAVRAIQPYADYKAPDTNGFNSLEEWYDIGEGLAVVLFSSSEYVSQAEQREPAWSNDSVFLVHWNGTDRSWTQTRIEETLFRSVRGE